MRPCPKLWQEIAEQIGPFATLVWSPIFQYLCPVHVIFNKIESVSFILIIPKTHLFPSCFRKLPFTIYCSNDRIPLALNVSSITRSKLYNNFALCQFNERISVAYYNYCNLSLITRCMKEDPELNTFRPIRLPFSYIQLV